MTLLERFHQQYVIPVIRETNADRLEGTCLALAAGGLKVLEITLMSESALAIIKKLSQNPDVIVGAGTVLTTAQAQQAIDNGAKFLISPGLNLEVVDLAKKNGAAIYPGVLTPTEIMAAHARGCDVLKIFPASAVGGIAYLNSLKGPFPDLKWMPSGGITLEDVPAYKKAGAICVGLGGKLIPAEAVQTRDWNRLTKIAAEHLRAAQGSP